MRPGVLDRDWKEPRSPESCQKTTNARAKGESAQSTLSIGMAIFGPAQKVTREALFHVNAPRADPLLYSPCDRSVVKIAAGRLTAALGPNKDARWRAAAAPKTKRRAALALGVFNIGSSGARVCSQIIRRLIICRVDVCVCECVFAYLPGCARARVTCTVPD
jgi:hypothetical protein